LAVGGVAIGLLSSGTRDTAPPTTTPATTADKPSPAATATVGAAEARVNAACLRVISEAQEVYDVLSGVGEAVDDVDLQRLDDMVRQLQPIEPCLKRDLEACNVDTSVERDLDATSASPSPSGSHASASPTPTR
jgi:hypothetical protein